MIISCSQLLSVCPGEGAKARLKIQTNAGGSSTHAHSMGKREGRGAEEKGGAGERGGREQNKGKSNSASGRRKKAAVRLSLTPGMRHLRYSTEPK